jgi:glyoxylase-like metal-dependent hydrolase (beta-lactamase superfamily II)
MRAVRHSIIALVAACASAALVSSAVAQAAPPAPQEIADGVWLIPGAVPPDREPDGNSLVFDAPGGLIVLDTGRHAAHRQAIEDFAASRKAPIVAIFNSHWHLDHTSGNAELKRAYPAAKVYASRAVEQALIGFLPKSAEDDRKYLASGQADPKIAEDLKGDIATIEAPRALMPDIPIVTSGHVTVGGRRLEVNLAANAATAGDVWLYDEASRVAASGDLVTLPAAFLDTACPAGWAEALDRISATPFRTVIPGHGRPLTRSEFETYRKAFKTLIACAASDRDKGECAAGWTASVQPLLGDGELAPRMAKGMTAGYVELLRANGGRSAYCKAPDAKAQVG